MAGERVLVVDDSLVYRDLLVNHVLAPNDYKPLVAQDGQSGLNLAQQESPDLIIMDMQMPGLTGIEVLEALHEGGSEIPVILMTLHGSEDLVVRAFRLGAKDYVIKPFDIEEMTTAIDRALTEVRLRHERDALTQELMETNRQLEAERRQLEAVLTNTEDGVLLVGENPEEQVILANHAAREAFDMDDDVTGRPLTEAVQDEILIDVFHRAKADDEPAHAEIPLPDDRTLNAHVTPIPGVGRVAVMQDITYHKELDRMKSEFVSTVSHDLRSPLTSIKGFADLLPAVGPLNEQQTYFLEKIQGGVENVTEMISDLLDLGRIEAEVRMEMALCDVGEIVEKAVENEQNQAVSNLASNAIKYTPEGGHISVSATMEGGQVAVTVEDDGIGIPQDDLPHIFERFYRVDKPETANIVGSGLGLSIVKTIVEKHQGRIWVCSREGEGTTFTFVLPAAT